jgi:hypothetical protein
MNEDHEKTTEDETWQLCAHLRCPRCKRVVYGRELGEIPINATGRCYCCNAPWKAVISGKDEDDTPWPIAVRDDQHP